MFCTKCGTYCADNDLFCMQCGAKLAAPIAPQTAPAPEVAEPTPVDTPVPVSLPEEADVQISAEEPAAVESAPADESAAADEPPAEGATPVVTEPEAETEIPQEAAAPVFAPAEPEPVPAAAAPVVAAAVPVKTRPKSSVLAKIISVLLCILIVLFSVGALTTLSLRRCLSGTVLANVIREADLLEMPVSGDSTLLDVVHDAASEAGLDLSKKEIRDAFNDSSAYEMIGELMDSVGNYLTGKTANFSLGSDEIMDFIEDNLDLIEEMAGEELSEADLEEMQAILEDEFADLEDINSDELLVEIPEIDLIRSALSMVGLVIFGGIALFLILIIFLINRRKYAGFAYTGISILISGALVGLISVGINSLLGYLQGSGGDELSAYLIGALGSLLRSTFGFYGIVAIGAGVVLIVLYSICASLSKRKYRKLAAAAELQA